MRLRDYQWFRTFVVSWASVGSGLIGIATIGLYTPQWELKAAIWSGSPER